MIKGIKGGNWLKETKDQFFDNYRISQANPSQSFKPMDEFDEYWSALNQTQKANFFKDCQEQLIRRKKAAYRLMRMNEKHGAHFLNIGKIRYRQAGIRASNEEDYEDLANLFKMQIHDQVNLDNLRRYFNKEELYWQKIFFFIHKSSRKFGVVSPMFRFKAFELVEQWTRHHFPKYMMNLFGTPYDPIFLALQNGDLDEKVETEWHSLDKEELEKHRKKFPQSVAMQAAAAPFELVPSGDQPQIVDERPKNQYAMEYEAACDSLMMCMSIADAIREFGAIYITQNYPSAYAAHERGEKQHLWYLRRNRNFDLDFFRIASNHALEMCKRGQIQSANDIPKNTIANVLADYKKAMGAKAAARLEAKKKYEDFARNGYAALTPIYQNDHIKLFLLDNTMDKEIMAFILSHQTQALAICSGSNGYHGGRFKPMINIDKPVSAQDIMHKQHGIGANYLKRVAHGNIKILSWHDCKTNEPVAVADLHRTREPSLRNPSNERRINSVMSQISGERNGHPQTKWHSHIARSLQAIERSHGIVLGQQTQCLTTIHINWSPESGWSSRSR